MKEIEIRQAQVKDCPALGYILVSSTNTAFRGLVPDKCLAWTAEESTANWKRNFKDDGTLADGDNIIVAETVADGVIGFAMFGKVRSNEAVKPPISEAYEHELRVLQVDPDWQRQGIGRLLVSRVAAELGNEGINHLLVRVVTLNPNVGFYERLGAVKLGTEPLDWDGFVTELSVYGWPDISELMMKEGLDG